MNLKRIIAVIVAVGVVWFAFYRGWTNPVQDAVLAVVGPVVRVGSHIAGGAGDMLHSFVRIRSLSRNLRALERENAELSARITELSDIKEENEVLRRELELLPREEHGLVSADVIGRSADGITETLILNRGAQSGIAEDMPVIVHEGVVVGKVSDVTQRTAVVTLVTDPSSRIAAQVQGDDEAQGVVNGMRSADLVMESIPRTANVSQGAFVVTTGIDGVFPPNLLIGTVQSVESTELDIFQTAHVASAAAIRQLRVVSVIVR